MKSKLTIFLFLILTLAVRAQAQSTPPGNCTQVNYLLLQREPQKVVNVVSAFVRTLGI